MGILYLFRAMCMVSTVLPLANHNYYCSPQVRDRTNLNHLHNSTTPENQLAN